MNEAKTEVWGHDRARCVEAARPGTSEERRAATRANAGRNAAEWSDAAASAVLVGTDPHSKQGVQHEPEGLYHLAAHHNVGREGGF